MVDFKSYINIIKQESHANHIKGLRRAKFLKYYTRWKKYLQPGHTSLNDATPWINFAAIDFLRRFAKPAMQVFEYGSGGSTLFWAKRVKKVYSVEHDECWSKDLLRIVHQQNLRNVSLFQVMPDHDPDFSKKKISGVDDYISNNPDFKGFNFEKYVWKIKEFPDNFFDVVVVDGRARPSCVAQGSDKLKPGGILVVDNTERDYILEEAWPPLERQGWLRRDFFGPVPYLQHFCKTTVLKKPRI